MSQRDRTRERELPFLSGVGFRQFYREAPFPATAGDASIMT
jgi:hypothetical protein